MALILPHRDMENDLRMQILEGLDKDGGGGLAIRIEITPNTDAALVMDGFFETIYDGA
jgi:hypothetical protein